MRREPSPQRRGRSPPPVSFLRRLRGAAAAGPAWGFLLRRGPPGSAGASARPAAPSPGGRGRAPRAARGPAAPGAAVPVRAARAGGRRSAGSWCLAGGPLAAGCRQGPGFRKGRQPALAEAPRRGLRGHRSAGARARRSAEGSPRLFRDLISATHILVLKKPPRCVFVVCRTLDLVLRSVLLYLQPLSASGGALHMMLQSHLGSHRREGRSGVKDRRRIGSAKLWLAICLRSWNFSGESFSSFGVQLWVCGCCPRWREISQGCQVE